MKQIHASSFFWRTVSIVTVFTTLYSSTALGVNTASASLLEFLQRAFAQRPGPFTDIPRPIYLGSNPKREPKTRGGLWSAQNLKDIESSRVEEFWASTEFPAFAGHVTAVQADPGSPMPWEGTYAAAGGGKVNVANGNLLMSIPIVGWKDRGGMPAGGEAKPDGSYWTDQPPGPGYPLNGPGGADLPKPPHNTGEILVWGTLPPGVTPIYEGPAHDLGGNVIPGGATEIKVPPGTVTIGGWSPIPPDYFPPPWGTGGRSWR